VPDIGIGNVGTTPYNRVVTELTRRFDEAMAYALEAHRDHQRKGAGDIPYVSHLLAVTGLVLEAGGDETAAIAAMLHDTIEDRPTPTRAAEIRQRFGDDVADAVLQCSAEAKTDTTEWLPRKQRYIAQMGTAGPVALLVSLADKVHNLRTTVADYRRLGEAKLGDFNAPDWESVLWYYESLADVYDERNEEPDVQLPEALRGELRRAIGQLKQLRRRPPCPSCGGHDVRPIVFGDPDAELIEQAEAGEVELGGCVVDSDEPDWICRSCEHRWRDPSLERPW
jgi:(p)ppGpp synthase/HD superfamily hydrolase